LATWVNACIRSSIVHGLELFQEQSDTVFDVLLWDNILTIEAHIASFIAVFGVEYGWHVEGYFAVRTNDFQSRDCSIVEFFCSLRLQNWIGNRLTLVLVIIIGGFSLCAKFKLSRVNSETLGHKVNLDAVNMLNKSRNRRQKLLGNVPI
jgi:hypothetical protein